MVTYHSRDELLGFLEATGSDTPLVVVDNGQGVDNIADLLADRPLTRYVTGAGQGFAAAANLGVRSSPYEFIVFSNPDTRPTSEIMSALVDEVERDPRLGACAAATTDESGHIELGVGGWEPTVLRTVVHTLGLHRRWPHAGLWARPEFREDIELEWMTGACLAVRKDQFLGVGGFDERYFVYGEDVEFGRTLRENGLRQRLRTDLLVPHGDAGSGGDRSTMLRLRGASMASYLRRHNSRSRAELMRLVLAFGSAVRLLMFARRRPRARHEWSYLQGLMFGPPEIPGMTNAQRA